MRPLKETLSEFGVEDLSAYEADLILAGRQDVFDDLADAARALSAALTTLDKRTPLSVRKDIATTLEQIEEALVEIEG